MKKVYYLTKEGLKNIEREHENLKNLHKKEVLGETPSLLESDSLNPEFSSFQEKVEFLEQRIEELNHILKHYRIIRRPPSKEQDMVNIGARVFLKNGSAQKEEYKIVGTLEADPFTGKISNESPLGISFIGRRAGETIFLDNGKKYKILKVKYEEA